MPVDKDKCVLMQACACMFVHIAQHAGRTPSTLAVAQMLKSGGACAGRTYG